MRRLAALVGSLTLLAAPLVAAATPALAADPGYHAPSVGQCRDMSSAELGGDSDPQDPVDCSQRHTARTIRVAQLPSGLQYDERPALERFANRACEAAVVTALGRTENVQGMSAYSWGWFDPTPAERQHGARWVRCDLVLLAGHTLAPLPSDETPALPAGRLPDGIARCLLGGKAILFTTCDRSHRGRATFAFQLDQKRYPVDRASAKKIARRCARGADEPTYRWTFLGDLGWKAGHHTVTCYTKTRS